MLRKILCFYNKTNFFHEKWINLVQVSSKILIRFKCFEVQPFRQIEEPRYI